MTRSSRFKLQKSAADSLSDISPTKNGRSHVNEHYSVEDVHDDTFHTEVATSPRSLRSRTVPSSSSPSRSSSQRSPRRATPTSSSSSSTGRGRKKMTENLVTAATITTATTTPPPLAAGMVVSDSGSDSEHEPSQLSRSSTSLHAHRQQRFLSPPFLSEPSSSQRPASGHSSVLIESHVRTQPDSDGDDDDDDDDDDDEVAEEEDDDEEEEEITDVMVEVANESDSDDDQLPESGLVSEEDEPESGDDSLGELSSEDEEENADDVDLHVKRNSCNKRLKSDSHASKQTAADTISTRNSARTNHQPQQQPQQQPQPQQPHAPIQGGSTSTTTITTNQDKPGKKTSPRKRVNNPKVQFSLNDENLRNAKQLKTESSSCATSTPPSTTATTAAAAKTTIATATTTTATTMMTGTATKPSATPPSPSTSRLMNPANSVSPLSSSSSSSSSLSRRRHVGLSRRARLASSLHPYISKSSPESMRA